MRRQIFLDTETTGISFEQGHRLVEIACIEYLNAKPGGRTWHSYLNPGRKVESGAYAVHGLSNRFLADKPDFASVAASLLGFVSGAQLIAHNAAFDLGFINGELALLDQGYQSLHKLCHIEDSLTLARRLHPGKKNSLDALCQRYAVDNSARQRHGAMLDAQLLAQVYMHMSHGQLEIW